MFEGYRSCIVVYILLSKNSQIGCSLLHFVASIWLTALSKENTLGLRIILVLVVPKLAIRRLPGDKHCLTAATSKAAPIYFQAYLSSECLDVDISSKNIFSCKCFIWKDSSPVKVTHLVICHFNIWMNLPICFATKKSKVSLYHLPTHAVIM